MTTPASAELRRDPRLDRGEVVVVRDAGELPSIRDAWLALRPDNVTADPDFFRAGLADPKILRPHVVVLKRDGRVEAMAVARLEQLELPHKLGYRTIYNPRVRAITVVYGGILGDPDEEQFELMLGELRRGLDAGEADIVIFTYLALDSPRFRAAATSPPFLSRQHVVRSGVHWELELPESLDALLRSKSAKHRQTLKRRKNRLERDFGDTLEVRTFESPSEIDEFFEAVAVVTPKTYQHALGVSFGDTEAHRERTRLAMERGWFRGYVLSLEGEPRAFWHGERYAGKFRTGNPGFDPAYESYSIGTYLLLRVIDDLCRDEAVQVLDHGLGDATYKQRYGTRSWEEGNVFVFARTFRGARLNLMLTVVSRTIGLARTAARRGGVLAAMKRRWRGRLGARQTTQR